MTVGYVPALRVLTQAVARERHGVPLEGWDLSTPGKVASAWNAAYTPPHCHEHHNEHRQGRDTAEPHQRCHPGRPGEPFRMDGAYLRQPDPLRVRRPGLPGEPQPRAHLGGGVLSRPGLAADGARPPGGDAGGGQRPKHPAGGRGHGHPQRHPVRRRLLRIRHRRRPRPGGGVAYRYRGKPASPSPGPTASATCRPAPAC